MYKWSVFPACDSFPAESFCASFVKHFIDLSSFLFPAQTCVAVGPVMLVSADGKLHLCTGASPRAKRSPQIRRPGAWGPAPSDPSSIHPQVKVRFQNVRKTEEATDWDALCSGRHRPQLHARDHTHGVDPPDSCPSAGATSPVHLPSSSWTLDSEGARLQMFWLAFASLSLRLYFICLPPWTLLARSAMAVFSMQERARSICHRPQLQTGALIWILKSKSFHCAPIYTM